MRRSAVALALTLLLPLPGLAGQVVVKQDETLSDIAARYHVSVDQLLQLNGIKDPKSLQVGTKLTVPGAPSSPSASGGGHGGGGGRSTNGASQANYTVKSGETISEIADRYGISSERLLQLNGIRDPKGLQVGSRIIVPTAGPAAKPAKAASASGPSSPASRGPANYTVKSGETISEIADRYGISSERLLELNGIRDPKGLQVGSRIVVPTAGPAAKPAKPPVLPAISPAQGKALSHTVRSGDTLSDIANTYGVPVERIAALNGLKDPDNLVVDTKLKLRNPPPVPKPATPVSHPPAKAASKPASTTAAVAPTTKAPAAKPGTTPTSSSPTPGNSPVAAPQATNKPAGTTHTPVVVSKPAAEKPEAIKPAATKPVVTTPAVTTPAVTTPAVTKPAVTKPVVTQPVVTKPLVAKPVVEKPAVPTAQAVKPEPKPQPKPEVKVETTPKAEPTTKPAKPDWRSFGPLQVDWANWQPMGGSLVAPGLNASGQSFYLAVNCSAKRINATGPSGAWKTWDLPTTDYEQQLVKDLCREKGG
jgi:LysM repeat protein